MDKILQDLGSIHWWIGIVAVGLAINLASAYLKPSTDRLFAVVSKWWATRSTKSRQEREKRMERLRASPEEQTFILVEGLHLRVRASMAILLSFIIAFAVLTSLEQLSRHSNVFMGFSAFLMIFGIRDWLGVIRRQSEVYEVRDAA